MFRVYYLAPFLKKLTITLTANAIPEITKLKTETAFFACSASFFSRRLTRPITCSLNYFISPFSSFISASVSTINRLSSVVIFINLPRHGWRCFNGLVEFCVAKLHAEKMPRSAFFQHISPSVSTIKRLSSLVIRAPCVFLFIVLRLRYVK
jgi:hypothetical protein